MKRKIKKGGHPTMEWPLNLMKHETITKTRPFLRPHCLRNQALLYLVLN